MINSCQIETQLDESLNPLTQIIQKINVDMQTVGWSVVAVMANPSFAYTIGLTTYAHPEIIIYGLHPEIAYDILNRIGNYVKQGQVLTTEKPIEGFVAKYPLIFQSVTLEKNHLILPLISSFFSDQYFLWQCFWPDAMSRFQWEPGFDPKYKQCQPYLPKHFQSFGSLTEKDQFYSRCN